MSGYVTVKGRYLGGSVFNPKENDHGKKNYSLVLVLDEGENTKVAQLRDDAITAKWGSKKQKLADWTLREGDDPEFSESYEKEFIHPKSGEKVKPKILVRRNGNLTPVDEDEGLIYPGCYVAVRISAYAYDGVKAKSQPPGVTLNFEKVLFLRHGEALGRKVNDDEGFEDLDSELDDDFMDEAA